MKELLFTIPKGRQPKYQRLAEGLRTAIREGHLKAGEVLPSSRVLSKRFKFDRHTVMNALSELIAEGWIESKEKVRYRVVETLPSTFLQPRATVMRDFQNRIPKFELARPVKIGDYNQPTKFRFAFPSGFPDPRLFPTGEFKSFLYDALQSRDVLLYGDPIGEQSLLEQISIYLRRVRNVSDRSIIVTNGSQEAIFLLAQLLVKPGDSVAVEGLGYPPALEAIRFAGARVVPVAVDTEGLVTDHLEKLLKQKKVRLIYVTPLHQYPTTVTLSAQRRLRLYELAYKYGVLILEDDYDHEFHYASQPVAPLASFDPGGLVIYVSTFSKILFPSARIGFVAVPTAFGRELAKLKRISSRQNEHLLQKALSLWMTSGGFERHLRRVRRAYELRLQSMVKTLEQIKVEHPRISWRTPDGGMAIWLDTGEDSSKLAARAKEEKIIVYPEQNYLLSGKTGTHLRLGFSGQTPSENTAGLKALSSVLRK
ncbi:MAG: PLP-dependent aminotransferase family protein [Bdellovibrionales bacterium]|nr:PLP-dependent aminotransferase family protein [Bdellovibrionales bacterium]